MRIGISNNRYRSTLNEKGGERTTIFALESAGVVPDKVAELQGHFKRSKEFMEKHPELFGELKSQKIVTQTMGAEVGTFMEILEFESLTEIDKFVARLMKNEEFVAIHNEAQSWFVPGTHKLTLWTLVDVLK